MKFKEMITTIKIKRRRRTRGAVLLEIALTMPFLLWVMFAICEYGMALNTINTLTQLTRDGARYAAVHATESTCYLLSTDTNGSLGMRAFMINESKGTSVTLTDAMITTGQMNTSGAFTAATPTVPGQNVAVQVTYDMTKRLWSSTASIVPGLAQLAKPGYKKNAIFIIEKP